MNWWCTYEFYDDSFIEIISCHLENSSSRSPIQPPPGSVSRVRRVRNHSDLEGVWRRTSGCTRSRRRPGRGPSSARSAARGSWGRGICGLTTGSMRGKGRNFFSLAFRCVVQNEISLSGIKTSRWYRIFPGLSSGFLSIFTTLFSNPTIVHTLRSRRKTFSNQHLPPSVLFALVYIFSN